MTIRPTLLFDASLLEPYLGAALAGRDWLLLTPNRRLASRIRGAVAARGGEVGTAAPVLALNDWLDQLWQRLRFLGDPLAEGRWVLSAAQELCLWEEAVRASGMPLLRPGQAAEQAAAAQRVLASWLQLPLEAGLRAEFEHQPDSRAFLDWHDRFAALCEQRGCIAVAERDRRVAEAVRGGRLALPAQVLGIGFDDLPPLQRALLRSTGRFVELEFLERMQAAVCVGANSFEEQLQAAALWVRERLRERPEGPFAIVVPDLAQQRSVVERALLEVLEPETLAPASPHRLPPLNFSAGEPLAQTPLVRSALQLLELAQADCERATLLELLPSPFHCGAEREFGSSMIATDAAAPALASISTEYIARALTAICELRSARVRAGQLRRIAEHVAGQEGWTFATALQQLAERARRERWRSARQGAADWAAVFAGILDLLGWPGRRTLDSIEYQQHQQWQQLLLQFAQYGRVLDAIDFDAALQRLRQLAQAQVFQAQTADLPVQVLGVLEAAGLQFEGVWLCDMGDDRWPPAAAPQPLLPRDLQRRLRMPRCDAQREYDIAARLGSSLLRNARSAVVSYQREREEVERAPSPLFQHLQEIPLPELLGGELLAQLPLWRQGAAQRARFALEDFRAGRAPALGPLELARGGSGLFKAQAACPFQSFAKLRLGAIPLPEPVAGLDAAERGNLLHGALEWLWGELRDHAALLALDDAAQAALAQRAATHAVDRLQEQLQRRGDSARLAPRFAELERQRLAILLGRWLDVERERGAFSVLAVEQAQTVEFAGLQLRLRIDRIDVLPDGRVLLIDYKTALCSTESWLGDRLDEPQLPLYGALWESAPDSAPVAGVAFAQVRLDKPALLGIGDAGLDAQRLREAQELRDDAADAGRDWPTLKAHWRRVLEDLAAQFVAGEAAVDPKKNTTCAYCALGPVCRIDHQDSSQPAPEVEANDG